MTYGQKADSITSTQVDLPLCTVKLICEHASMWKVSNVELECVYWIPGWSMVVHLKHWLSDNNKHREMHNLNLRVNIMLRHIWTSIWPCRSDFRLPHWYSAYLMLPYGSQITDCPEVYTNWDKCSRQQVLTSCNQWQLQQTSIASLRKYNALDVPNYYVKC